MTYGEAFAVQPFGNLLVTMDLTGAQLHDLLEQQAVFQRPGGRDVLILGVSQGFAFTYNPDGGVRGPHRSGQHHASTAPSSTRPPPTGS